MREFTLEDGFALSEILDKMDFKLDLNAYADDMKSNQAYIGGQLVLQFLKKMHLAKGEVMRFIASMTEQPLDDVKKWGLAQIKTFFEELGNQEGIKDFFS